VDILQNRGAKNRFSYTIMDYNLNRRSDVSIRTPVGVEVTSSQENKKGIWHVHMPPVLPSEKKDKLEHGKNVVLEVEHIKPELYLVFHWRDSKGNGQRNKKKGARNRPEHPPACRSKVVSLLGLGIERQDL